MKNGERKASTFEGWYKDLDRFSRKEVKRNGIGPGLIDQFFYPDVDWDK